MHSVRDQRPSPPAILRRLLGVLLPRRERDEILVEMDCLYRLREARVGRWRARLWYLRRSLGFPPRLMGEWTRRLVPAMSTDVGYAVRSLRAAPGFTAVAVMTLALGIGANSAVFGLINAVFFRAPSGVSETERLVWISRAGAGWGVSYADYRDLRDVVPNFDGIAAYQSAGLAVGSGGAPARVTGQLVSDNYFDVLGVAPALGRDFLPRQERVFAAAPVVVLGNHLWRARFGAEPDVVGQEVTLNGSAFTVIGVAPPGFVGVDIEAPAQLWVPSTTQPVTMPRDYEVLAERDAGDFRLIGRLAENVTQEQGKAALSAVASAIDAAEPARLSRFRLEITPLRGWVPIDRAHHMLPMIGFAWIVAGTVLLIACANVGNLMLLRGIGRRTEIAVRMALGVGRVGLLRLLLAEGLLLSLAGGALGLVVAHRGADWFQGRFRGTLVPLDVSPDLPTLVFTLGLSTATAVLFGLAPAWRASRLDLVPAIRGEGPLGLRRSRLQGTLVVVQIALAMVLLIAAGLFLRKLHAAQRVDVGFDIEHVLTLSFDLHSLGYSPEEREVFVERLAARAVALPGVRAATVPAAVPLVSPAALFKISLPGREGGPDMASRGGARDSGVAVLSTGPALLRTLEIALLRGRDIREDDLTFDRRVAVISESLARRYWPDENAVGKHFVLASRDDNRIEIVGVARDIAFSSVGAPARPHLYVPHTQGFSLATTHLLVRGAGDPTRLAAPLRDEIRELEPNVPVDVRTLQEIVDQELSLQRSFAAIIGGFGALALLLACLGLWGVTAFTAAGRTREIGVRIALGGDHRDVLRVFVRDGMRLAGAGLVIGGALALMVGRLVSSIAAGVDPVDPVVFSGVAALLSGVALVATYIPARRAARVDPIDVLRME